MRSQRLALDPVSSMQQEAMDRLDDLFGEKI
jgi:hypothetical protein